MTYVIQNGAENPDVQLHSANMINRDAQHKARMQMNVSKIIYLSSGERYEFMIDHRICTHILNSCEI